MHRGRLRRTLVQRQRSCDPYNFQVHARRGVEQDDEEAVRWYRLAAEQGLAWGQYDLGRMYAEGRGVEQDDEEAVRWYRLAAEQGLAEAQEDLAREGWGCDAPPPRRLFPCGS